VRRQQHCAYGAAYVIVPVFYEEVDKDDGCRHGGLVEQYGDDPVYSEYIKQDGDNCRVGSGAGKSRVIDRYKPE
jgi:hypothetical protein